MDDDLTEVKGKLGQLKDTLLKEFDLPSIMDVRWEQKRNKFISAISELKEDNHIISEDALKLLFAACEDDDGTILKTTDLSGTYIETNNKNFIVSQERREIVRWESALKELISAGFIEKQGTTDSVFTVSKSGYDYIEQKTENNV